MIEFIYKEPTIAELFKLINRLNNKGYETNLCGRGDGSVSLEVIDKEFTIIGGKKWNKKLKK